jgi:hypothetical protein
MTLEEITKKYGATFKPVDISKTYGASFTPESVSLNKSEEPKRNILQKGLGLFLDPIINTGARLGQAVGDLALTGINKASGGALDKYTPEGNLDQALQRAENTPDRVPILGTPIKPTSTITPENIAGNAVSTVALAVGNPVVGGALIGAGAGMSEDKSPGIVALDTVIGAVSGKILQAGFNKAIPVIERAAVKYGQPFLEKIAQYVPESSKTYMSNLADKVNARPNPTADIKLNEMLSPKPTPKQVQLAQAEDRLYPGKERTTFKSGTEDKIATSDKTFNATQTVKSNIPNASKMSPSELYTAVDSKITEKATKLRPQMEATPIKPETIEKINTDWQKVKESQIIDAPATEEPNVLKRQIKFEALLKKSGNQNHADLWDTRIEYDNSIPEAVKKANPYTSSESLLLQKDEWLQNRQILNSAIDATAKPEFKAMSELYEAKNNLLSKAKLEKAQLSKVKEVIKNHPYAAGAIISAIVSATGIPAAVLRQAIGD